MLTGGHPLQGPGDGVDNPRCAYSWVFECWHKPPGIKVRCGRQRLVECGGRRHVRLDDAIKEIERYGWRLDVDGGGWRCLEHVAREEQPGAAAVGPRAQRSEKEKRGSTVALAEDQKGLLVLYHRFLRENELTICERVTGPDGVVRQRKGRIGRGQDLLAGFEDFLEREQTGEQSEREGAGG